MTCCPYGETTLCQHGRCDECAVQPVHDDEEHAREAECRAKSWQLDGYAICREPAGHAGRHVWEVQ